MIFHISKDLTFEPLSQKTLASAKFLQNLVFKNIPKNEKDILEASLYPDDFKECFIVNNLKSMSYYIVRDQDNVVAIVGLYEEIDDKEDICWLGWLCVDLTYRRFKIGKKLLDFIIDLAKQNEKNYLHLYTYNSKEFKPAIALYNQYGFEKYTPDFIPKSKKDLFFKLDLSDVITIKDLCLEKKYFDDIINIEWLKVEIDWIDFLLKKYQDDLLDFSKPITKDLYQLFYLIENMNINKEVIYDNPQVCFVENNPLDTLHYSNIFILVNRIKALIYALKISNKFNDKNSDVETEIMNLLNSIEFHFQIYKHEKVM